ncbi:MAG: methyltransferase domain-containing protein [Planctomycetota bacterium]|jgi:SAM-dependent methyltransferase
MICRVCRGHVFGEVIDLGSLPLVNNLLEDPGAPCPRWPLRVVFCRGCSLVQLTEAPSPDSMFRDYAYFTGQSATMVEHAAWLVERHVQPDQRVVEIASNDGYLLVHAQRRGAHVLGVDPAANLAAHAGRRGIPTRCAYFDESEAASILAEDGLADVIFANNVLAHVPDPGALARGIRTLLSPDGLAHVEVPYLVGIIESGAFDTIYHEHQCYFSASALRRLFNDAGLSVVDVSHVPVHGGSLHLVIAHEGDETGIAHLCREEVRLGLFDDAFYEGFADRVDRLRQTLHETMQPFDVVAGYGAAAKSVVLLNTFDIQRDRLPWIADVNPHKQGRFVPGTGQPVVPPDRLVEAKPDACILFPWNLREEITAQQRGYLDAGGRFIVPIPEVEVL